FTVSVNGGPDVLFIDTPTLTINALNGDDDILLRTPAPNDAIWNVQVTIDGGTATNGDTLRVETPDTAPRVAETVLYTPTGINSGTLNITSLTSLVTLSQIENLSYVGDNTIAGQPLDNDILTVTTPNATITP